MGKKFSNLVSFMLFLTLCSFAKSNYYCFYVTSFNPVKNQTANKDFTFELVEKQLKDLCSVNDKNIFYLPKPSANRNSIEIAFEHLSKLLNSKENENNLFVVFNGFYVTDSCLVPLDTVKTKMLFTYQELSQRIIKMPIKSVFYGLNVINKKPSSAVIDSISSRLFVKDSTFSQNAIIILSDSTRFHNSSQKYMENIVESFDGGGDSNFDAIIGPREITNYLQQNFVSSEINRNIFIKTTTLTADSFKFELKPQLMKSFKLPQLQGDSLEFAVYADKPRFLVFGATYCTPCITEKTDLKRMLNQLRSRFDVTYISVDEPDQLELARRQSAGYPFIFLHDPMKLVFSQYRLNPSLPLTMIVDDSARIRYKKHGYIPSFDSKIQRALINKLIGTH